MCSRWGVLGSLWISKKSCLSLKTSTSSPMRVLYTVHMDSACSCFTGFSLYLFHNCFSVTISTKPCSRSILLMLSYALSVLVSFQPQVLSNFLQFLLMIVPLPAPFSFNYVSHISWLLYSL